MFADHEAIKAEAANYARISRDARKDRLRDEFAMAALTGFLANSEAAHAGAEPMTSYLSRAENAAWVAQRAYILADAMLAARSEERRAGE